MLIYLWRSDTINAMSEFLLGLNLSPRKTNFKVNFCRKGTIQLGTPSALSTVTVNGLRPTIVRMTRNFRSTSDKWHWMNCSYIAFLYMSNSFCVILQFVPENSLNYCGISLRFYQNFDFIFIKTDKNKNKSVLLYELRISVLFGGR